MKFWLVRPIPFQLFVFCPLRIGGVPYTHVMPCHAFGPESNRRCLSFALDCLSMRLCVALLFAFPVRPTGPSTMFWPADLEGMAAQLEPRVRFVMLNNNICA